MEVEDCNSCRGAREIIADLKEELLKFSDCVIVNKGIRVLKGISVEMETEVAEVVNIARNWRRRGWEEEERKCKEYVKLRNVKDGSEVKEEESMEAGGNHQLHGGER